MSAPLCSFCDRVNPTGAKFCNACGSPLNLRPCSSCDAVNQAAATVCYSCGADLVEPILEMAATAEGPALRLAAPNERESKPLPESAADILALLPGARVPDHAEHAEPSESLAHRVASEWRAHVMDGTWNRAHPLEASARASVLLGHRTLGTALLIGLFVVAFTVLAFYGYRHPAGVGNWLDNRKVAAGFLPSRERAKPALATDASATRESPNDLASNAPAIDVAVEVPSPVLESSDALAIDTLASTPADAARAATAAAPTTPSRIGTRRDAARHASAVLFGPEAAVQRAARDARPEPSRPRVTEPADVTRCTEAIVALALCAPGATANGQ